MGHWNSIGIVLHSHCCAKFNIIDIIKRIQSKNTPQQITNQGRASSSRSKNKNNPLIIEPMNETINTTINR